MLSQSVAWTEIAAGGHREVIGAEAAGFPGVPGPCTVADQPRGKEDVGPQLNPDEAAALRAVERGSEAPVDGTYSIAPKFERFIRSSRLPPEATLRFEEEPMLEWAALRADVTGMLQRFLNAAAALRDEGRRHAQQEGSGDEDDVDDNEAYVKQGVRLLTLSNELLERGQEKFEREVSDLPPWVSPCLATYLLNVLI